MLAQNKKVSFHYDILEKYDAGLELFGFEVKSVRQKQARLDGSYIIIRGKEAFIVSMHVPPFQVKNTPTDYDPNRPRKLLVSKKELTKLEDVESQKGLTLVPISLYNKGRFIKLQFAVARGKKKHDKRETLKEKDAWRDVERTLKEQR